MARELKRNRTHKLDRYFYYPYTAERKYRRRYCHRRMFTNDEIVDHVSARSKETLSPEQISCTPWA